MVENLFRKYGRVGECIPVRGKSLVRIGYGFALIERASCLCFVVFAEMAKSTSGTLGT